MTFRARVHLFLEADALAELLQKISALHASYPISDLNVANGLETYASGIVGAVAQQAQQAVATSVEAAEAAVAPKARAARIKSQAATDPAAGAAASSPAPDANPAPAPAPASEKTQSELVSELRAVLTPLASRDAAGRKTVNAFITSKGFRDITVIPAEQLPAIIAEAKGLT